VDYLNGLQTPLGTPVWEVIAMIGHLLTGRYLILERLGAGGFSETYLARDKYLPRHPLCVVKFLKLSSSSTISESVAQRLFETEAYVLQRLGQHHGQIPTLFAYCDEQEQAYLIQEYIEGESLSRWLARGQRLTSNSAIALLLEILPVLATLHTHGIIHRDIKPSNIIRRRRDGRLVLIDFGAACILPDANSELHSSREECEIAIGTPGYIPDEQLQGLPQLNSDIYALGILVIHLLTGTHPREFELDPISGEMVWQCYFGEKLIDPKLMEVLERMVRVKLSDRYQQVSDILVDLRPLAGMARSPRWSTLFAWKKPLRRMLVPMTAVVLMGLMGSQFFHTHRNQTKTLLAQLEQRFGRSDVQLDLVQDLPVPAAINQMLITPDSQVLITAGSDQALRLSSLPSGTALKTLYGHRSTITALAVSRDSRLLVSGSEDGIVYLWDLVSGQSLRIYQAHRYPVTTVAISPDNRTVVSGCKDGTLRQWDVQTGVRMQTLKLPEGEATAVVYGATPDRLISAASDRQLQVWDLHTGRLHRTFAGHTDEIIGLQVADHQTLYSFGKDRGLKWDLKREELAMVLPKNSADPRAISLGAQNLITVHGDGSIRAWNRTSGVPIPGSAKVLDNDVYAALSPNHQYLVSWNSDQRLRIWRMTGD
jgi:serine/threonine protein kinase